MDNYIQIKEVLVMQTLVIFVTLAVIVMLIAVSCIKIVPQAHAAVIELLVSGFILRHRLSTGLQKRYC